MKTELEELEKWQRLPDWSEKLTAYSGKLSISELNAHIGIITAQIKRMEMVQKPPNSLFIMHHHFLDHALMKIAINLQNQEHDFKPI